MSFSLTASGEVVNPAKALEKTVPSYMYRNLLTNHCKAGMMCSVICTITITFVKPMQTFSIKAISRMGNQSERGTKPSLGILHQRCDRQNRGHRLCRRRKLLHPHTNSLTQTPYNKARVTVRSELKVYKSFFFLHDGDGMVGQRQSSVFKKMIIIMSFQFAIKIIPNVDSE